ncbi:hypothetical protein [uncultured Treponema sp.]|uniref:hypothetical protein n=1 Tax=uncultured Treponema sp. TaxID=162155 RepID=UPI002634F6CC|nr:hypothetical protein [uncultured Treponema sp.]
MIEERIVVSDSNIFFDLLSVDLLNDFFLLPCEITTTDFVISEIIKPEQLEKLQLFIDSKKLDVINFVNDEINKIFSIFQSNDNNASITDCSVWYYAKKVDGRLLTGDSKLRKSALADNVKVSGILYIFDNFVEYGILEKELCAKKLEELMQKNSRLPKGECEKRIVEWRE